MPPVQNEIPRHHVKYNGVPLYIVLRSVKDNLKKDVRYGGGNPVMGCVGGYRTERENCIPGGSDCPLNPEVAGVQVSVQSLNMENLHYGMWQSLRSRASSLIHRRTSAQNNTTESDDDSVFFDVKLSDSPSMTTDNNTNILPQQIPQVVTDCTIASAFGQQFDVPLSPSDYTFIY